MNNEISNNIILLCLVIYSFGIITGYVISKINTQNIYIIDKDNGTEVPEQLNTLGTKVPVRISKRDLKIPVKIQNKINNYSGLCDFKDEEASCPEDNIGKEAYTGVDRGDIKVEYERIT